MASPRHFTPLFAAALIALPLGALPARAADEPAAPVAAHHAGHHGGHAAGAHMADFASGRITIEVVGTGPDVVLIHGLSSSREVWHDTVEALPGYRYHLVQIKGFAGKAPEDNGSGPVVLPVADEIARYIADAGLTAPALVGHSMGGTIAMAVASRHPGRVGRVMVVDMLPDLGVVFAGPGATADVRAAMAERVRAGIAGATGDARKAQTEATIAGMVRTESRRAAAVQHSMDSDPDTSGRAMADLIQTDLSKAIAVYKGPMAVLWVVPTGAPFDQPTMAAFYRMAYAAVPQAVVTHIPDSAHFIMWDAPDRFRAELTAFLTAAPAP